MKVIEVIEELNNGKPVLELASELNMSTKLLITKLNNAAVEFEADTKVWKYIGPNKEISLNRDITKTIKLLAIDKPFVKRNKINNKQSSPSYDSDYTLYKDYLSGKSQEKIETKKTIFFSEDIYDLIKSISKRRSLKISVLIHVLLTKGLEFYSLEDEEIIN